MVKINLGLFSRDNIFHNYNGDIKVSIVNNLKISYSLGTINTIARKGFLEIPDVVAKTITIFPSTDYYIPAYDNKEIILFSTLEEAEGAEFSQQENSILLQKNQKYNKAKARFTEINPLDILNSEISKIDLGSKNVTNIIANKLNYSFGVEIETINGHLPYWVYFNNKLSLNCIRDGSLRNPDGSETGGEYVTGVLRGDQGFFNLKKSLIEISKRCGIDKRCGIHVHVGGCIFNSQFNVLAYILALKLEEEVFETLPPSRRDNETCGKLFKEDYLNIIKNYNLNHGVEICYEDLFYKMSNNRKLGKMVNRKKSHPGGRYCDRYSRHINPKDLYRYKWINFISSSFNMKGTEERPVYTLEFRSHPASLNYDKIMKWILFCFAFCNYVENNTNDIINKDNITIEDILTFSYKGEQLTSLVEYFKERKETFSTKELGNKNELLEYKQKTASKTGSFKRFIESCV